MTPPRTPELAAKRILVGVALIQLVIFLVEARGTMTALVNPHTANRPVARGAFIRVIDGHGYYAWLRSSLIDGDWQFENEFDFYRAHWPEGESLRVRTPTGRTANQWSVGPAVAWSVAVVPVHLILTAAGSDQAEPVGYAPAYQLGVGGMTFALSIATLLFVYGVARHFAGSVASAAAAGVLTLGTPLLAYGTVEVGMSHGPGAAALAGYVFVWVRSRGSVRPGRWFLLGLLLGVTCLMRWQLATFALLPALEAVPLVLAAGWRGVAGRLARITIPAALGALVGFAPQIAAWWVVYGSPIHNPHPIVPAWSDPSLWGVLGSTDRSLFYWTPVTLFAVLGLLAAARPCAPCAGAARAMLLGAAIQIYLLAAIMDRGVHLGWSFGFRFLTETCVVLVVGLAIVFERFGSRRPVLLALGFGALVLWNLMLLGLYRHCVLPAEGAGPDALVRAVAKYLRWRPLEAVLSVAMATWLTRGLARGFSRPVAPGKSLPAPELAPERLAA